MGIYVYLTILHLASLWNPKAKAWVTGRKNWKAQLKAVHQKAGNRKLVWVHCASLGEFEQGRPVIEAIGNQNPKPYILLTFFSPSGFEIRKNYTGADAVIYLPADTPGNAKDFTAILQPDLAIFVKYEYWLNLLSQLHLHQIPVLMVSSIFRDNQIFFKWYGSAWRTALTRIRHFFVQDAGSEVLLQRLGITEVTVAGDTRFDRVLQTAAAFEDIPEIRLFCGDTPVLVAGSTWPEDEQIIAAYLQQRPSVRCILAPHEIHTSHLEQLDQRMPMAQRFTSWEKHPNQDTRVLVIDNIGMLSKLYHYATVTYVGGGFGKGIHNTLEAAVYGKPVLFGPRYEKFREARELIATGGAVSVTDTSAMTAKMDEWLNKPECLTLAGRAASDYVISEAGATQKIMSFIQANRLLTS
ncbi:MAG: 3-deoxy-D-manno-octulosonic acid transferase [Sphingobacteriales bacterium]|nr:MAG: 3-deoxy-D-manno-octulosonic acid transferase [Sphingobacteriales bacterium]